MIKPSADATPVCAVAGLKTGALVRRIRRGGFCAGSGPGHRYARVPRAVSRVGSSEEQSGGLRTDAVRTLRRKTHQTIARVTSDFEKLDLNTNVAALMELLNALSEFNADPASSSPDDAFAGREAIEALVVMLTPYAPHVAEEMWEGLGSEGGLLKSAAWPVADPELAKKGELEIPVQVNGKLRSRVIVAPDISEADLRTLALADPKCKLYRWASEW